MFIDLHIHTIATPHHSFWEPEALVAAALEAGLGVIAVSDHNITAQVAAVQAAGARRGLRVIAGAEIDTGANGKLWHTHMYGIDPQHPEVLALCEAVVTRNAANARELYEFVQAEHGWRSPWLEALERTPNVADVGHALVIEGYVPREQGVEDEAAGMAWVLRNLGHIYRPVTVAEAAQVAHSAGGLAVLAHPGRSKSVYAIPADERDLELLAAAGLDGVEVLYPTHSDEQRAFYAAQATRLGLLVTAGSDSHGPKDGLGRFPAAACAGFLARLGIEVPDA